MKIQIFTTGGTIDKIYSEEKGTLNFSFGEPAIKELAERKLKLSFEYQIEALFAKDSLEMTDADRELILQACKTATAEKILITHGSDTIIDTAKFLSVISDKAVVLTGAPQPYRFRESNAEFNIGVAIGALGVLSRGVYVAMNGRVFEWDTCQKLPDGRFAEK